MTTLAEIESLEYATVAALAKTTKPDAIERLTRVRDALAAKKRELLAAYPAVLRKTTSKLHSGPAPTTAPNTPMPQPDGSIGNSMPEKIFRAPTELFDLSIHTCRGQIHVPPHGVIHTAAHHGDLHAELRGRGFRELKAINRFGKALDGTDPADAFRRDRLAQIGAGGNLLRALGDRAAKASVPSEIREEHPDGPGPRPTYCTSASAWRRHYFGET